MDYRTLGRTGLNVSIAGVGSGGASRLGLSNGGSEEQAIAVIHRALDLGVNYVDTAEQYRTEEVVGRALLGRRDKVVLSSKIGPRREDDSLLDAEGLRRGVEVALGKLQTDVIDVYHLHRPTLEDYPYCADELVPELFALRDAGKIRFLAISESTSGDARHQMLARAVEDDCWDVVMIAFNAFNQSARDVVFPTTIEKGIAIEIMGAARGPYSRQELLVAEVARLIAQGEIDPSSIDAADPLGFLLEPGVANSLAEASYRFAAHEPGVHVVLSGTGSLEHLQENLDALSAGPLPGPARARLVELFGSLAVGR